ncbi:alpha-1,3-mannosyl-glycoprotein 4-beta-N-acetylglucosaminyltransferase B-like [Ornithodoros turicata]|uniref:alpha-1,3-mannosyl-glycoprotein 4-beta-N-acetylglucosaminyltransferase B-like n=1 Tax=Ornithodoros turicata TaxID=34597 RepID=UPI0031397729
MTATACFGFDGNSYVLFFFLIVPSHLEGPNGVYEISLPSVRHFLAHLPYGPDILRPSFVLSRARTGVEVVVGVPTVKRQSSYLERTLQSLVSGLDSKDNALIIVLVAEVICYHTISTSIMHEATNSNFIIHADISYVSMVAEGIKALLPDHVESGLLEIVSPPACLYSDLSRPDRTHNDPEPRLRWRSKQALDYAYLMMYARERGKFYVQLEDDVQAMDGYMKKMLHFAHGQQTWLLLDFCALGFIGKMFKNSDLVRVSGFLLLFHKVKPVDWLLLYFVQTVVCQPNLDDATCKRRVEKVWRRYSPSLFQHVGIQSSLEGKYQTMKDASFMVERAVTANPPAQVESFSSARDIYSIENAYAGTNFFWTLPPMKGDNISFKFTPPITIQSFTFRSGNSEHPDHKFTNTTVEVLPLAAAQRPLTPDGYYVVGRFTDGVASGSIPCQLGLVAVLRLRVHEDSHSPALLSEVYIEDKKEDKGCPLDPTVA